MTSANITEKNVIVFRTDASSQIGTGHIMRCLALAQAWKNRGGRAIFLVNTENPLIRQRIQLEGFECISFEQSYPHPNDISFTIELLNGLTMGEKPQDSNKEFFLLPWLVLDGYHFDSEYQKTIKQTGLPLMVIDDMAHLSPYHCHVLLNQGIRSLNLNYHYDSDTKLLMGNRYVLLREEFLKYRGWQREISQIARKILVTLGGADSQNVTLQIGQALLAFETKDLEVKIIIGAANPHLKSLQLFFSQAPANFQLLLNPGDMPELMAWADIGISAGGGTAWEMAFMGLPNLVVVLADNQKHIANELACKACSINMGNYIDRGLTCWVQEIRNIVYDKDQRKRMSENGPALIDGLGVHRVIDELISYYPKNWEDRG